MRCVEMEEIRQDDNVKPFRTGQGPIVSFNRR